MYMLTMFALMGIGFFLIFGKPIPGSLVIGIGFIIAAYYVAWRGRLHRKKKMEEQAEKVRLRNQEFYENK